MMTCKLTDIVMVGILSVFLLGFSSAARGVVIVGDVADTTIAAGSTTAPIYTANRVGSRTNGARDGVYVFQLPALPPAPVVTSADLEFSLLGLDGTVPFNADLYGLPFRAAATVSHTTDFFVGPYNTDASATAIQQDILVPTTAPGRISLSATGQANLVGYLNQQIVNGATPGQHVFLRLNPNVNNTDDVAYNVATADHPTAADHPTLTLEAATGGNGNVYAAVFQDGLDGYAGTEDTYLERNTVGGADPNIPDYNFGGADRMKVFNRSARDAVSLLRFDLSSLESAKEIKSAWLLLTTQTLQGGGSSADEVAVHRIAAADAAWVEGTSNGSIETGTATWNHEQHDTVDWDGTFTGITQVLTAGELDRAQMAPPGQVTQFVFGGDLSFLLDWAQNPSQNAGFLINSTIGDDFLINDGFYTSEAANLEFRPMLVVTYSVPEPAGWVLLVLATAAAPWWLGRRRGRAYRRLGPIRALRHGSFLIPTR